MKAISLWQPWASLIAKGAKRYETRSWPAPQYLIGQTLAICAAKTTKGIDAMLQSHELGLVCVNHGLLHDEEIPFGVIVAVCQVIRAVRSEILLPQMHCTEDMWCGDWSPGRWGWELGDVRAIRPVPVKGKQGIFNLSAEEAAGVMGQIEPVAKRIPDADLARAAEMTKRQYGKALRELADL